jgi:hypothetical protein
MSINVDDIVARLPAERQARIKELSQQKIQETLAYAALHAASRNTRSQEGRRQTTAADDTTASVVRKKASQ